MLIMTRRADQTIRIGNDIVVTVVKVRGKQVWIGVEAPPDVEIYREEDMERQRAKRQAKLKGEQGDST